MQVLMVSFTDFSHHFVKKIVIIMTGSFLGLPYLKFLCTLKVTFNIDLVGCCGSVQ